MSRRARAPSRATEEKSPSPRASSSASRWAWIASRASSRIWERVKARATSSASSDPSAGPAPPAPAPAGASARPARRPSMTRSAVRGGAEPPPWACSMRTSVRDRPARTTSLPSISWMACASAVSTSAEPMTFARSLRSSSSTSPDAIWGLTKRMTAGSVSPWMMSDPAATRSATSSRNPRIGTSWAIVCDAARVIAPRIPAHTTTAPSRGPRGSFAKYSRSEPRRVWRRWTRSRRRCHLFRAACHSSSERLRAWRTSSSTVHASARRSSKTPIRASSRSWRRLECLRLWSSHTSRALTNPARTATVAPPATTATRAARPSPS